MLTGLCHTRRLVLLDLWVCRVEFTAHSLRRYRLATEQRIRWTDEFLCVPTNCKISGWPFGWAQRHCVILDHWQLWRMLKLSCSCSKNLSEQEGTCSIIQKCQNWRGFHRQINTYCSSRCLLIQDFPLIKLSSDTLSVSDDMIRFGAFDNNGWRVSALIHRWR